MVPDYPPTPLFLEYAMNAPQLYYLCTLYKQNLYEQGDDKPMNLMFCVTIVLEHKTVTYTYTDTHTSIFK